MRFPDAEILVMARAPEAGKAKTRLIPALGEEGAAGLHSFLVERLLSELTEAAIAPVTLCCTPATSHPFFRHCQQSYNVTLKGQQGVDLGERLHHALTTSLKRHRFAVVIGCDIPDLDSAVISEALQALKHGHDAAITPTEDGGYALLAVKQAKASLFTGINWGSEQVFQQTTEGLETMGWRYKTLQTLWDLDRPDDLHRLRTVELPPSLASMVGEFTAVE